MFQYQMRDTRTGHIFGLVWAANPEMAIEEFFREFRPGHEFRADVSYWVVEERQGRRVIGYPTRVAFACMPLVASPIDRIMISGAR